MFRMGDEERQKEAEKTKESGTSAGLDNDFLESQTQNGSGSGSSNPNVQFVPIYPTDSASNVPIGFRILLADGTEVKVPSGEELRKLNSDKRRVEGVNPEEGIHVPRQAQSQGKHDESLRQPKVSFSKGQEKESSEKNRGKNSTFLTKIVLNRESKILT